MRQSIFRTSRFTVPDGIAPASAGAFDLPKGAAYLVQVRIRGFQLHGEFEKRACIVLVGPGNLVVRQGTDPMPDPWLAIIAVILAQTSLPAASGREPPVAWSEVE